MRQAAQQSLPSELYDEQYFLGACEGYEEFIESRGEYLSRRLSEAFAVAQVEPQMSVLDVGCGRGEIVRHCTRMGATAYGIDYAAVAAHLAVAGAAGRVYRADARRLPFPDGRFERVLMFDIVEHLYPWELRQALHEARRVLAPGGKVVVHTAPNRWYDAYAYPLVRLVRTLQGQGRRYPPNPRALNVAANEDVHVNEQDMLGLWLNLRRAGFGRIKVWLSTPPQKRREGAVLSAARHVLFNWVPLRWFFEREVFAVATRET